MFPMCTAPILLHTNHILLYPTAPQLIFPGSPHPPTLHTHLHLPRKCPPHTPQCPPQPPRNPHNPAHPSKGITHPHHNPLTPTSSIPYPHPHTPPTSPYTSAEPTLHAALTSFTPPSYVSEMSLSCQLTEVKIFLLPFAVCSYGFELFWVSTAFWMILAFLKIQISVIDLVNVFSLIILSNPMAYSHLALPLRQRSLTSAWALHCGYWSVCMCSFPHSLVSVVLLGGSLCSLSRNKVMFTFQYVTVAACL